MNVAMTEALDGTELTCRQIIDYMQAFLDGELPPRERTIFELHLNICPDCVNYLRSYQATLALAKRAARRAPPESPVPDDLVRAILAARKQT